jgi:hypothetical protein
VGGTWKLLGDMAKAHAYADTARMAFAAQSKAFPEAAQLHELLGRALALGGWKQEAVAEAELSLRLRETELDFGTGPYVRFQVARILIQSGELDKALDLIEPLLKSPGSDLTRPTCASTPASPPSRAIPASKNSSPANSSARYSSSAPVSGPTARAAGSPVQLHDPHRRGHRNSGPLPRRDSSPSPLGPPSPAAAGGCGRR